MKIVFVSLFMFFFPFLSTVDAKDAVHIVAIVNGQAITQLDLDNRVTLTLMDAPQQPSEEQRAALRRNILEKMIDELLQIEEAKRFEVQAEQEDIDHHLNFIAKQNDWPQGYMEKTLKEQGVPMQTLLQQINAGISWARFAMLMKEGSRISSKDVENYIKYKQHKMRYLLAEIIIPFDLYGGIMAAEQLAYQVFQSIQKGQPFNMMAFEHSGAPTAASGGDIDWVDADQLLPEVKEVLERMPVGSLSQPIPTAHDFRIIFLREKQDPSQCEQILKLRQIEVDLPIMMPTETRQELIRNLEKKMRRIKTCSDFESAAEGIENATLQIHQNIRSAQLSGGLEKVVSDLPLNTPSKLLIVSDHKLMLFMVCEKTNKSPDEEEVDHIKKEVKENIENKRLESLALKRLQDLRRQAYIDVRI